MAKFAERVKELRQQFGLQQGQLGERVGVTGQTVSLWERGLRYPTRETLSKLADHFNVHIEYLTGESDDSSPRQDILDAHEKLMITLELERIAMHAMRFSKLSPGMKSVIEAATYEAYRHDRDNGNLDEHAEAIDITVKSRFKIMENEEPIRNLDYPKSMEPPEWDGKIV